MLNAPQRRFSLAVWSNLNTSTSYIPLCAHSYQNSSRPQCLLRVPEHWGPISISRLPICLLRVPQHWVPFSISRLPLGLLQVPEPRVPFQSFIKHNTYFGNIISITRKLTVSKSNINQHAKFNFKALLSNNMLFKQVYFQIFHEII